MLCFVFFRFCNYDFRWVCRNVLRIFRFIFLIFEKCIRFVFSFVGSITVVWVGWEGSLGLSCFWEGVGMVCDLIVSSNRFCCGFCFFAWGGREVVIL